MRNFFTKNGMILLTTLTVLAVVLCIVSAASSGTGFVHNALGVIASPFRAAGGAVSGWVTNVGDYFDSLEELQQTNNELSWSANCARPKRTAKKMPVCARC